MSTRREVLLPSSLPPGWRCRGAAATMSPRRPSPRTSPDSGELPGNDLYDVLEATDPEKEDYKEILDQVQEEAEESPPP